MLTKTDVTSDRLLALPNLTSNAINHNKARDMPFTNNADFPSTRADRAKPAMIGVQENELDRSKTRLP